MAAPRMIAWTELRPFLAHPATWARIYARRWRNDRTLRAALDLREEHRCVNDWEARQALWNTLDSSQRIVYLEFGVQKGTSLYQATLANQHPESRFYGFDSFEGIPEDWTPRHRRGAMKADPPRLPDPRVRLVPGWFADTVPGFFDREDLGEGYLAVVHIDPDLFSSAIIALSAVLLEYDDLHLMVDDCTDQIFDAVQLIRTAFGRTFDVGSWSSGRAGFAKTLPGRARPAS